MNIRLKKIIIRNFKGCRELEIEFRDGISIISGANATGKTTIIDAFLWLLFDRDSSGNSKFGIRTVDENGKEIDNLEISVEVILDVDGKEITFKKIQKQKWTKHRGSSAPTFEGNVNTFEIDGFPQSKTEYQKRIAEIIPEDTFRLIADLRYFSGLDWKEKRKLLLDLCGDVTDMDVFADDPGYWEPIKNDVDAAGVDKAREKAKKSLKELNQRQKEIPVRIDELSGQFRQEADENQYKDRLAEIKNELVELMAREETLQKESSTDAINAKIKELESERHLAWNNEDLAVKAKYNEALKKVREQETAVYQVKTEIANLSANARQIDSRITIERNELNRLKIVHQDYSKEIPFDEKSKYCLSCGQILPESRINEIVRQYEGRKAENQKKAQEAIEKGRIVKSGIEKLNSDLDAVNQKIAEEQCKLEQMTVILDLMNKELASIPQTADINSIPRCVEIWNKIAEQRKKLETVKESQEERARVLIEIGNLNTEARMIEASLNGIGAVKEANARIQERIDSLKEEQKETGQLIALCEQKLILLEEFSMKKSELLSKKITSCFELTNFSLFSQQINGGLVEECEITLNGVKYRDMNSGHRIIVAMDIIKAFSNKIGVHAPLFIDNSESVNDFNLPEMPCQLILLKVSDDKELVVS